MDSFSDEDILSLPMYSNVAKLLADDKDKIIIDIGCGDGCQQFLFDDFKGYIGIDKLQEPISICDNCTMYHGDCKDILPNLKQLFIVSDVVITVEDLPKYEYCKVKIQKFEGKRCERCWNYFNEKELTNNICPRCEEVLKN